MCQQLERYPDLLGETSFPLQGAANEKHSTDNSPVSNSPENTSFLVSTFLVFDIISSASLNTAPTFQYHKALVTQHANMIETVSGCNAEVLLAILDVTKLALWKQSKLRSKRLDILELALPASTIKHRLVSSLMKGNGSSSAYLTPVYTHAALIYLLVSMSGAHTSLPGLQDHISALLNLVSDGLSLSTCDVKAYLAGMVWPFAIAGSMADLNHQQAFRHLISGIDSNLGNQNAPLTPLRKAQSIMEHCWETRNLNPDQEIGWLDAMHNLGLKTVLL